MNELLKRGFFGTIYVVIMWYGTAFSEKTFQILFLILGLWSIYEMWKLRKGKTKLVAILIVVIPFFIIQLFGMTDTNYPEMPFNPSIILLMFVLTWTFDSFAYLVGKKFGKNKILPSISPKKSWEGFFGGYLFCILASSLSFFLFKEYFNHISTLSYTLITIILPFSATTGDFIESFYKRKAGVKDSGTIIPGHGGILDRMDAFLITIPVIYIIINIT
ncbi:MAG: phosphatidate cytidylyltransferase [Bacteroidota bacterium]|nr:phosphatidate cytidylyltransferase [Bacteroidota bacterium]